MKSIVWLRVFSLLGFLLLVAPFYQQCTFGRQADAPAEEAPVTEEIVPAVSDSINLLEAKAEQDSLSAQKIGDSIYEKQIPIYVKAYEFIDEENSDNAYEMALRSFKFIVETSRDFPAYKSEVAEDWNKNEYDLIALPIQLFAFIPIVILTSTNLYYSFKRNPKRNSLFALLNLILLTISFLCIVFFDSFFDTWKQIKWGFYVFPLVQVGIIVVSCKVSKE
jgi:hypothetical protein